MNPDQMTETTIRLLFQKYLKDECSKAELLTFNRFLADHDNGPFVKRLLEEYAEIVQDKNTDGVSDEQIERLYDRIKDGIDQIEHPKRPRERRHLHFTLLKVAAVIVFCVGIFWLFYQVNLPDGNITLTEYTTRKGQKSRITLSDGSVVHLNADSKLTFPERFNGSTREVILEGEAFFEVTRKENMPFIVRTGDITTTVLGTTFNINTYQQDNLSVAVATGKVLVTRKSNELALNASDSLLLIPNQIAHYDPTSGQLERKTTDIRHLIAWKDKVLVFQDKNLDQAIEILERWYGTEITAVNGLEDCFVSGEFNKSPSLQTVLEALKFVHKIDYKFTSKGVMIEGKNCE